MFYAASILVVEHRLKKLAVFLVKFIKAYFIIHPQVNQQCTSQAGREANQVDKECAFEPLEVAVNQEQVVLQHIV
jgi:hypothetical protein